MKKLSATGNTSETKKWYNKTPMYHKTDQIDLKMSI